MMVKVWSWPKGEEEGAYHGAWMADDHPLELEVGEVGHREVGVSPQGLAVRMAGYCLGVEVEVLRSWAVPQLKSPPVEEVEDHASPVED